MTRQLALILKSTIDQRISRIRWKSCSYMTCLVAFVPVDILLYLTSVRVFVSMQSATVTAFVICLNPTATFSISKSIPIIYFEKMSIHLVFSTV